MLNAPSILSYLIRMTKIIRNVRNDNATTRRNSTENLSLQILTIYSPLFVCFCLFPSRLLPFILRVFLAHSRFLSLLLQFHLILFTASHCRLLSFSLTPAMEQSRHIFILCNRHLRRQHKAVFLDLDIRILLLFI